MKLTDNFSKHEFESKDGVDMPKRVLNNIKKLAIQLQIIREYTGLPITINSGYRSPEHNRSIGGSKGSQHKLGKAADIVIEGLSADTVYELVEDLIKKDILNIKGLGKYDTFTHVDIRDKKARW